MTDLMTARSCEELLAGPSAPAPYEYALLFHAEGWLARRRAKARLKFLRALDGRLRRLLHPGERVYFLTAGTTTTVAEQFFAGWLAYYYNRRALVFTTERVLLLQIDQRQRPGVLMSQLAYTAIADLKSTWDRFCQLRLRNGQKLNFAGVPAADRKYLRTLLADALRVSVPPIMGAPQPGIEHLCPHCLQVVAGLPAACPHCHGGFKSARKAGWLSALFPGLGDLYLGHHGRGVLQLLVGGMAWLGLVVSPLLSQADPNSGPLPADYWLQTAISLAFLHGLDAAIAYTFASKGLHPARAAKVPSF